MQIKDFRRWINVKSAFRSRRVSRRDAFVASQLIEKKFKAIFDKTKVGIPATFDKLDEANSYLEMVDIVKGAFPAKEFWKTLRPCYEDLKKREAIANILVQSGEEYNSAEQYDLALHCYSLGAQFAKRRSKLLMQIYWEMSNIAIQVGDLDGARELELAAKKCSGFKSYKQKFKSQIQHFSYPNIRIAKKNSAVDSFSEKVLFKVYGKPSKSTNEMGKCVAVKDSDTHGKGTFLKKYLEPGTTVISERPYAATLIDSLRWNTNNCYVCFKKIKVRVPCEKCVFNIYCSVKCRNKDYKNGHKYECPILPYIHCLESGEAIHMCLKTICRAGPETLRKACEELRKSRNDTNTIIKTPTGEIDKYSYILNLCSHPVGASKSADVCLAFSICHIMRKRSKFFRGFKGSEKRTMIRFVAAILVRHLHSIPFNQFAIYDPLDPDSRRRYQQTKQAPKTKLNMIGFGIYPVADILNHSCDPNAFRFQTSEGRIAVVTNRILTAGTELLLSYGPMYSLQDKESRQECLKKLFYFQCGCPACAFNWPLGTKLNEYEKNVLCPNCSEDKIFKSTSDASAYLLTPNSQDSGRTGICGMCNEKYMLADLRKLILKFEQKLKLANDLVLSHTPLKAIPILKVCIGFFQMTLCPPSHQLCSAQHLLDEALTLVSYERL